MECTYQLSLTQGAKGPLAVPGLLHIPAATRIDLKRHEDLHYVVTQA